MLAWPSVTAWTDVDRALDNIFVERLWCNVKCEDVYLKGYANMAELMGLAQCFAFYNAERPHQALAYQTPSHADSAGGGAVSSTGLATMRSRRKRVMRGSAG